MFSLAGGGKELLPPLHSNGPVDLRAEQRALIPTALIYAILFCLCRVLWCAPIGTRVIIRSSVVDKRSSYLLFATDSSRRVMTYIMPLLGAGPVCEQAQDSTKLSLFLIIYASSGYGRKLNLQGFLECQLHTAQDTFSVFTPRLVKIGNRRIIALSAAYFLPLNNPANGLRRKFMA